MQILVLHSSTTRGDFTKAASSNNYELADFIKADSVTPLQIFYSANNGETTIRYVEDFYIKQSYIDVSGQFVGGRSVRHMEDSAYDLWGEE